MKKIYLLTETNARNNAYNSEFLTSIPEVLNYLGETLASDPTYYYFYSAICCSYNYPSTDSPDVKVEDVFTIIDNKLTGDDLNIDLSEIARWYELMNREDL